MSVLNRVGGATLWVLTCLGCESGDWQAHALEPESGDLRGQTQVRVVGKHFKPEHHYEAYFGKTKAEKVLFVDESTLMLMTPASAASGPVDVTVIEDRGKAYRIKDAFKYVDQSGNPSEHL